MVKKMLVRDLREVKLSAISMRRFKVQKYLPANLLQVPLLQVIKQANTSHINVNINLQSNI